MVLSLFPAIAGVGQEGPAVNQPSEMRSDTSSDLVLVDVIALMNGLLDKSLKRDDFQVFDDAHPVYEANALGTAYCQVGKLSFFRSAAYHRGLRRRFFINDNKPSPQETRGTLALTTVPFTCTPRRVIVSTDLKFGAAD